MFQELRAYSVPLGPEFNGRTQVPRPELLQPEEALIVSRASLSVPASEGGREQLLLSRVSSVWSGVSIQTVWLPHDLDGPNGNLQRFPSGPSGSVLVVPGLDPTPLKLHTISWDPWFDRPVTLIQQLALQPNDVQKVALNLPQLGSLIVELVEPREPVSLVLDATPEWTAGPSALWNAPTLSAPARHLVRGTVLQLNADDWPDLCVALVGEPVAPWRLADVGARDVWARPDGWGAFRFEQVPSGDYTFLLYRPRGDHEVDVLAARSVSVRSDLFNLDIWPEPQGSPLRRTLASAWSDEAAR